MLATILSFLGGGVMKEIAAAYRIREQAKTQAEKIAADERIAHLQQIMADRDSARQFASTAVSNPVLVWPISVFVWFVAMYYGAIVLDSIWFHSGSVQQLPGFAQEWSTAIIYSVFTPMAAGGGIALAIKAWRG